MYLTGTLTLVTGGTGQLGRVVVRRFTEQGARVIVPYRSQEKYLALRSWLGSLAEQVDGWPSDLTDWSAVQQLVTQVIQHHGQIDHVLCLAGGFVGSRFLEAGPDQWDRMHALNVQPTLLTLRATLPYLVERGRGRAVTIGARQALEPSPGASAYAASKAAVILLTQSIARELRGTGVTINCVVPSTIDTETNRQMMPKADPATWVKPESVAALLLFLCSPEAEAINGAVIPVYAKL